MKAPLNIQALFHDAALYDTEATPDGILLTYPAEDTPRKMGYARAIQHLDSGGSDDNLPTGMRLAAAVLEGTENGWHTPAEEDLRALWRWVVVAVFMAEQEDAGNTLTAQGGDGRTVPAAVYTHAGGGYCAHSCGGADAAGGAHRTGCRPFLSGWLSGTGRRRDVPEHAGCHGRAARSASDVLGAHRFPAAA